MNEFFKQVSGDALRIWNQLTQAQRLLVGAVGAAAVGLLVFLVVWAQQPNYTVLFTKLGDQDAGSIVEKLKEQGVPYQLEGASIKVPAAQVHEVRLALAGEGLPSGGTVGFQELFNGANWSATDFERKLNYQRGLEGELSRTIASIEGVEKARVHIVIPKEQLFTEEEQATTASVLLTTAPMAKLELGQVKAIQHLVAKAVPNLAEANVFVTDTAGRDYTEEIAKQDPKNFAGMDVSARQLDIKRKYEREEERRLQAMLDPVLGPSNSVVRVSTSWDFSQIETNAEVYTPSGVNNGALMISEKGMQERYNGQMAGAGNGGVPGANPNVAPDYQAGSTQAGNYEKNEFTRNYVPNKEVQRRIKEPAVLRDKTISVAFNPPTGLAPEGVRRQADNIARMVAAAAGIEDYQKKVFVNPIRFNTAAADEEAKLAAERERQAQMTKWATVGGTVLLSLVALILLLAAFRRKKEEELEELIPALPSGDLGITLMDGDRLMNGVERVISAEDQRLSELRTELVSYVKAQPHDAAKLVKSWMTDEE